MPNANEVFRDFERFTGDGKPGAPTGAPLPIGDPRSGSHNLDKFELRQWGAALEALNGNPDALNARLQTIDGRSTPSYPNRAAAEAAASALPTNVTQIFVREGAYLVERSRTASAVDPLFSSGARWGVMARYPNEAVINDKADLLNSGKLFPSRNAAANMGQASLPTALGLLFTQEGNGFAIRNPVTNVDDPLFDTVPHWGVIMRMPSTDLMSSLLAGKAPTIQGVIPVTLPATGNGENYALTISQMPVGGQLYYFTANADSVGAPTVTITSGVTSLTTPLVFADGRGSAVLRAGSIYIVQHTPNATLVLSQKDAAPDAPSPVALARAVAGSAAPNSYGTHQPLEISGPVPFQLQPFQSRSCVQMQGAAGVIDCSYVVPGTVCEVFLRAGDKVIAGNGRNFVGQSVGMATATGESIVRIVAFYGRVGIEQVCGPAVSFSVADAIAYNDAVVLGGQSNAQLGYSYGIIGGFSKAMRTSIATPLPRSVRWINGALGGTAIDRRSKPAGSTEYWWDAVAGAPGPSLNNFMTVMADAISSGSPVPSICYWTQGEADTNALQSGTLTIAQLTESILSVWAWIRSTYPNMRFVANMIGSHDQRLQDRGATAVRRAYLQAIQQASYASHGVELYDLQRADGDVHYFGHAYSVMGARFARHYANLLHGQSNVLGPRVTGATLAAGNRTLRLAVDWGGPIYAADPVFDYSPQPFGIYLLAPNALPSANPLKLLSGSIEAGQIVLRSGFDMAGHQVGGPWGFAPFARRGQIIRDAQADLYHLMAGQPLRSFHIQL